MMDELEAVPGFTSVPDEFGRPREGGTIELVGTDTLAFYIDFAPTAMSVVTVERHVPSPASNTSDHEFVASSFWKIPCDRGQNHWAHRCRHQWIVFFEWSVHTPKTLTFKVTGA